MCPKLAGGAPGHNPRKPDTAIGQPDGWLPDTGCRELHVPSREPPDELGETPRALRDRCLRPGSGKTMPDAGAKRPKPITSIGLDGEILAGLTVVAQGDPEVNPSWAGQCVIALWLMRVTGVVLPGGIMAGV